MADPFVGEIRLFAGAFAPSGWAVCDGQVLSRAQNPVLHDVIGDAYGGDGMTTFALPDLRGRVPLHVGGGVARGQAAGQERVTLTVDQLPAHHHELRASNSDGDRATPEGSVWARSDALAFSAETPDANMRPTALVTAGAGGAHDNVMPFLGITFIIALEGIVPTPP
jgi:microcystin-dependent protein